MQTSLATPQNASTVPVFKGKAVAGAMQTKAAMEIQAAVFIAKQFPRNQVESFDRVLIACERESLAEKAIYCYQRGGSDITGPSIRLAEAIAVSWGNIDCGIVEVDRDDEESTIMAYAWDLETNSRSVKTFTVPHQRHTKRGVTKLTDSRDIYEHVANNGARRLRSCILAIIPGDLVEAAVEQCNKTLVAKADVSPENIKKLVDAFSKFGVTKEMIESRIQRKIDAIRPAQIVNLRNVFNSIRDGMSEPSDWFAVSAEQGQEAQTSSTPASRIGDALDKALPGDNVFAPNGFVQDNSKIPPHEIPKAMFHEDEEEDLNEWPVDEPEPAGESFDDLAAKVNAIESVADGKKIMAESDQNAGLTKTQIATLRESVRDRVDTLKTSKKS